MSKRKRETADQELSRERRRRSKKRKTGYERTAGLDEAQAASEEVSQFDRTLKKPITEAEANRLARILAKREKKNLKRIQEGEGIKARGTQPKDRPSGEDQAVRGELLEIDNAKRRKRKKKSKHRNQESQGQDRDNDQCKMAGGEAVERDSTKRRKRKKKSKQRGEGSQGQDSDNNQHKIASGELAAREKSKKERRNEKLEEHNDKADHLHKQGESPAWKVSDPVGGHMLDLDPIFSHDEEHLLVAYDAAIAIYSTSTSLLVRQLRVKNAGSISGFAVSSETPSHLYISTESGIIEKWDWVKGFRLRLWKLSSSILSLIISSPNTDQMTSDIVYTVDKKGKDSWLLSAHRLLAGEDATKTDVVSLLKYEAPLSFIKVLERGRIIVATSESQMIFGYCKNPAAPTLKDLAYTWRVVECPEWPTSIDVRIRQRMSRNQAEKKGLVSEAVDVAIGGLKGAIHVYEDILNKVIIRERHTGKDSDTISRKMHWHRNSVLAIKWSLDGNYVISGGEETTLVLWQLETGQRQNLPHLGAPIESIVVSPSGSSYSVRLADNSAMILSTSELKPTFSISGIQIAFTTKSTRVKLPFTPTIDVPMEKRKVAQRPHYPACASAGHLLLAAPSSVTPRSAFTTTLRLSYLQTFDIGSGHQLSRQALTRTKVTDLNMGPELNTIEEPDVTHIQTSFDGQWLATVDEWMPPERDLAPLAFDKEKAADEQIFRQETHLKFWLWKDDAKVWELVSRIDRPHASPNGNLYERGRVLELVSDPVTAAFATVGEDGLLKTWRPAIRRRHGLEVRSKDGKGLTSWHCKHIIPLESTQPITQGSVWGAKLAYSQDGSVLAAGLQSQSLSSIYLIDTYSGEVRSVQTGLYSGSLLGLGIINKYLITLGHELCVWDLVADERHYGVHLDPSSLSLEKQLSVTHLAVNVRNSLFAVAVPELRQGPKETTTLQSQVAIFDPTKPSPLFRTSLPSTITNLLPAHRGKGFYAIDSAAEVRTLVPSQSVTSLSMVPPKDEKVASRGLNDIFCNGQNTKALEDGVGKHARLLTSKLDNLTREPRVREEDAVVVSSDRLAEVFDVGPAYSLPPVTELFEQVASLYSGRVR